MLVHLAGNLLPRLSILLVTVLLTACEPDSIRPVPGSGHQWLLPGFLHEASGLALSSEGLLIHDDETGFIYNIANDFTEVRKVLQLENPVVSADFEGIAVSGSTVYLMDSEGYVYIARDVVFGPNAVQQRVIRQQTGLGEFCELEGLEYHSGLLLIPCKIPRNAEYQGQLTVFSFDPETGIASEFIRILLEDESPEDFQLSAIAKHNDDYYLLATSHLVIVNPAAQTSGIYTLDLERHPQPEGIVVSGGGSIAIVDDRRESGGIITVYGNLDHLRSLNGP